jgi:murein DD-endopeptidase MepM/ murein hydrolase activator NlpD
MKVNDLVPRNSDGWGQGHFQAPRGTRYHKGVDLMCYAGSPIHSHVSGKVTKHGYCYNDDLSYRYVEVTAKGGMRHRFFYVSPIAEVGDQVIEGDLLGTCQDIQARYKDRKPDRYMVNHVHYEVLMPDGTPMKPRI